MSGVTDALLQIAASAGASHVDEALARVEQLRTRHLAAARTLVAGARATRSLAIDAQFDELAAVVKALAVLREVSPRTLDVVAAMGETLSSRMVAAALIAAGLPGEWVDARRAIVTNDEHTCAVPDAATTDAALRATVRAGDRRRPRPGARRLRRRHARRPHDDARPRRVGLFRRARRRRHRRARDSDLDRRRRHADRRSAHRRRAAARAAAVVCRGRGARVLRREGAAPEHDPAGGRAQHPGAHPELAQGRMARGRCITADAAGGGHAAHRRWRPSAT